MRIKRKKKQKQKMNIPTIIEEKRIFKNRIKISDDRKL